MHTNDCESCIRGGLVGAVIGDALGLPGNNKSSIQINLATGGRGISGISVAPINGVPELVTRPTANTAMLFEIIESIVERRGIDHAVIAAIINRCTPNRTVNDNTLAKAVLPIAMFRAIVVGTQQQAQMAIEDDLQKINESLGLSVATVTGATAAAIALLWPMLVGRISMRHENTAAMFEAVVRRTKSDDESASQIYDAFLRTARLVVEKESLSNLKGKMTCGSLVWQSLPFSLLVFMLEPREFDMSLGITVNAGGDASGNGVLVGGLMGVNGGLDGITQEWFDALPEAKRMDELACRLIGVAKECS
ncbi:MAG: ADP-ribosylglycohydrolase family protein [Patescibacteria group bacterium]